MKKLIIFIFVASLALPSFCQTSGSLIGTTYSLSLDTLTDAGTKYLTSPTILGYFKTTTVSFTLTNISGTTAATVSIQHSNDNGSTWYSLISDTTFTVSGAATKGFKWNDYCDKRFRFKFVGSGTQSTQIKATYLLTK